jgi:UDP-N-acetyl-D-galactosamine dehydrogenase
MEQLAVIGLGYVGLPLAVGCARRYGQVVGFDVDAGRVDELRSGIDRTGEVTAADLAEPNLRVTRDPAELRQCSFFIIAVPTPIDADRRPDLRPLQAACATVGGALRPGAVVVVESTVYPGVVEDLCGPWLAEASGLQVSADFTLGYSPERINPGDRLHRLETIRKVIAAGDPATLDRLEAVYGAVVPAGVYRAASIKVAEAAKVIENTQRDLNIALMNELALIFDRLGLRTKDVLDAAETKWNFLRFTPGLVGGHCIGVDPYYLTAKAEAVGYHPEVILAGRRINDAMGRYLAQKLVKLLVQNDVPVRRARVGILGLTFKEDVPDLRNSRVPDIVQELREFGIEALVHDPLISAEEAERGSGITLTELGAFQGLDAVVLAVAHRPYLELVPARLAEMLGRHGIMVDVKSALDPSAMPAGVTYWSL